MRNYKACTRDGAVYVGGMQCNDATDTEVGLTALVRNKGTMTRVVVVVFTQHVTVTVSGLGARLVTFLVPF